MKLRKKSSRKNGKNPPTKRRVGSNGAAALTLATRSGVILMRFSGDVVNNVRNMMTFIGRKGEFPNRLSLTSTLSGEGVTYISRALATVMANDLAARVCLVDLNWWSPSSPITPSGNGGIVSAVVGETRLDKVFVPTALPNLTLLPAGRLVPHNRPIMARSNVLKSAIDVLGQHFDYIIMDVPAIRSTNDAIPLAALGTGCCLIVRQGITTMDDVRTALDEVGHLDILGIVLNQVTLKTPSLFLKMIPHK